MSTYAVFLECHLCCSQLRNPKSLPCMHSFCEECLKTSILKEKPVENDSFLCPTCFKVTMPVNEKETGRENWAAQFPTNTIISTLETQQRSDPNMHQHFCHPCHKKGINDSVAEMWWREANRYFCKPCLEYYTNILSEDDTVIEIARMKYSPDAAICEKHGEKTDLVCDDHHVICCPKCVAIEHRRCDTIRELKIIKSSDQMENMRKLLQDLSEAMELLVKDFQEQKRGLTDARATYLQDLSDLRQRIDQQLVKMQTSLSEEGNTLYQEETKKLDDAIKKCETIHKEITSTIKLSETDILTKDDMLFVSAFLKGALEVESCKALIKEMAEPFLTVGLEHTIPNQSKDDEKETKTEQIDKIISSLTLGSLRRTSGTCTFPIDNNSAVPLSACSAVQVREVNVKLASDEDECLVTGLLYLPNGHVIVVDQQNEKVKMFAETGDLLSELHLSDGPRDVCLVEENKIAVTRQDLRVLSFIEIKSSELKLLPDEDLNTAQQCDAVVFADGRYLLSTGKGYDYDVYSLSKDGRYQTLGYMESPIYGVLDDPLHKGIIFGSYNTVYRMNKHEEYTELANDESVSEVARMDMDQDGNVYVCGISSNNVVQISRDGTKVREMVQTPKPFVISVRGRNFVVSSQVQTNFVRFYSMA